MKNTTTKKASAKKKLLPAAGSLLISAAMLGTSTYAWFTMNKEVTVTGMTLKTKVSGNLLICGDNVEANYAEDLSQARAAFLEPVSTINGLDGSFYYTVHAQADGDAIDDDYILYNEDVELTGTNADAIDSTWTRSSTGAAKTHVDDAFNNQVAAVDCYSNANYKAASPAVYDNAYGYVDYTFYLKATADSTAATTAQELRLTECNLIRNNLAITDPSSPADDITDDDLAWRVAIFAENITSTHPGDGNETTNVTGSGDEALIILTRPDAANQTPNSAVSGPSAVGALTKNYNTWKDGHAYIDSISTAGATSYYKVVARVWLEGEDKSCKSSTYALLRDNYEFGMQFELVDAGTTTEGKTSVASIGTAIDNDTGTIMASGS
jgi:hypothetical protein